MGLSAGPSSRMASGFAGLRLAVGPTVQRERPVFRRWHWKRQELEQALIVPPKTDETTVACVNWLRKMRTTDGRPDTVSAIFEGVESLWSDGEEEEEMEEELAPIVSEREAHQKKEAAQRANSARERGVAYFKQAASGGASRGVRGVRGAAACIARDVSGEGRGHGNGWASVGMHVL